MRKQGVLNPIIPGEKIYGIFGFCKIHQFLDTVEILEETIMLYVNEISFIVHNNVDFFGGSNNKNIGESYLLVWKFKERNIARNQNDLMLKKNRQVSNKTDLALYSIVRIIIDMQTKPSILKYNIHPGLTSKTPDFKVRLYFGLHTG